MPHWIGKCSKSLQGRERAEAVGHCRILRCQVHLSLPNLGLFEILPTLRLGEQPDRDSGRTLHESYFNWYRRLGTRSTVFGNTDAFVSAETALEFFPPPSSSLRPQPTSPFLSESRSVEAST